MNAQLIIFYALSLITVGSASLVAFSRNIITSAFALLGVFAGVAGIFILLSADFVAIVQLVIYIGGILVLILFAVMLTTKVESATGQRKLLNRAMAPVAAFIGVATLGILIFRELRRGQWADLQPESFQPMTSIIGERLLREYLLPFEIASILLVLVLIGAIVLARREVKEPIKSSLRKQGSKTL